MYFIAWIWAAILTFITFSLVLVFGCCFWVITFAAIIISEVLHWGIIFSSFCGLEIILMENLVVIFALISSVIIVEY